MRLPDGSTALAYDDRALAAIDLSRGTGELPGWAAAYQPTELQALLAAYRDVDAERLWDNLGYFLERVVPVAERAGVRLAIHPDDPPWPIFGLPRIITNARALERLVALVDSPANGVTFCTGSLGASPENDLPAMVRRLGGRIHFAHCRNVRITGDRQFHETAHPSPCGSVDLFQVLCALRDVGFAGPMRPDHGRMIWGETGRPGYGLYDRIGVRRGFAAAVVAWSLAAIAHAFARTTALFSAARALLGVAESANFPGAIKAVAEWFPKKERALATGIFNAGTNTGAIVTPLLVPWIALTWGWQWAFIATGSLGFLWLLLWLAVYRSPESNPRVSSDELAHIRSDPPDPANARVPWIRLLGFRQTWAVAAGKLLADPIWWFYLYWLPKFLDARYGIKLAQVALPLIVVYVVADVGSVGGGWLSSTLIKRGWTV